MIIRTMMYRMYRVFHCTHTLDWMCLLLFALISMPIVAISGDVDCKDGSHFVCDASQCISDALKCDGVKQCHNGLDEVNCPEPTDADVHNPEALPLRASPHAAISAPRTTPRPTTTTTRKSRPKDPDPTGIMNQEQVYLWLPLIAVVIFTGIMVILILIGRSRDRNNNHGYTDRISTVPVGGLPLNARPHGAKRGKEISTDTGVHQSLQDLLDITLLEVDEDFSTKEISTTITEISTTTTTTTKPTTTTTANDDGGVGTSDSVDIVSIATVMVIFCITLIVCIVLGCKSRKKAQQGSADVEQVSLTEENSNPGYEGSETGRPSTPPPSYSVIERQTSYASYISQSSSQLSVPPDYDDAVELPTLNNGLSRPPPSSASNVRRSRSNRAGGSHRIHINRPASSRLFSRSVSATEPSHNTFRSLSSTAEANEETAQNPRMPRNSSDSVTTDNRSRIASEESSVFIENEPDLVGMVTFPAVLPSPTSGSENDETFLPQPGNASSPIDSVAPEEREEVDVASASGGTGSSPSRSGSPPTPEPTDASNGSAFALLGEGTGGGPNAVNFYVEEDDDR